MTLRFTAVSRDRQAALNAVSYGQDDGTGFIAHSPSISRTTVTPLQFRTDGVLADGVLFLPQVMEHKWALFFHGGQILCIRSWQRKVYVTASVEQHDDSILITSIRGAFLEEVEEPDLTARILNYLLITHVLRIPFPAPLPKGMEQDPKAAAMWCMSLFGNTAHFATPHEVESPVPEKPLRTHSLLHISVARGDREAVDRYLEDGRPIDLLAADGLAPLHWALATEGTAMLAHLLRRGSPVDVRSDAGATPLMNAVQDGLVEKALFLLDRGADPDAADLRGYTSLHRAAELGKTEIVQILLARGASVDVVAQGHTPLALAEMRRNVDAIRLLREATPRHPPLADRLS